MAWAGSVGFIAKNERRFGCPKPIVTMSSPCSVMCRFFKHAAANVVANMTRSSADECDINGAFLHAF